MAYASGWTAPDFASKKQNEELSWIVLTTNLAPTQTFHGINQANKWLFWEVFPTATKIFGFALWYGSVEKSQIAKFNKPMVIAAWNDRVTLFCMTVYIDRIQTLWTRDATPGSHIFIK